MLKLRPSQATKASALVKSLIEVKPPFSSKRPRKQTTGHQGLAQRDPLTRVDIVNESLCDDIISYLSPTLSQHVGCTLIDLQPGACLFSSKIHEYLKPKQHLLVEPDEYYFKPFIKPLLDQPDSTYRYTPIDISHSSSYWWELQRIQEDTHSLPSDPSPSQDDPIRKDFNPNVLVIGNLSRRPDTTSPLHTVQLSKLLLHNLGQHVLSHQYLQSAGLVRMLIWTPEYQKKDIFAVLPWRRTTHNVGLSLGFHISEAACVHSMQNVFQNDANRERRRRSPVLDSLNRRDVQHRMRKAGMSAPAGRQLCAEDKLEKTGDLTRFISPLEANTGSVAELLSKIETVSSRIETMHAWIRNKGVPDKNNLVTLEFPQVALDAPHYCHKGSQGLQRPSIERVTQLADLAFSVISIEAAFKAFEDGGIDESLLQDLARRIQDLNQVHNELVERASPFIIGIVQTFVEDHIAYWLSPSVVTFDNRSYEPLKADLDDFWPQTSLSLFDFMPKGRDLAVPDLANHEEATRFCVALLQTLFNSTGLTLPQGLDRVGINAAQDLIPMVPAITDARKGGRLDPSNLRVRMITEEMVEGLVKAFFEWPFRPQSWELALHNDGPVSKDEESETDQAV